MGKNRNRESQGVEAPRVEGEVEPTKEDPQEDPEEEEPMEVKLEEEVGSSGTV